MAYSALPTRTTADIASSADVNQLQENIRATRDQLIGGVYAITADYTILDADGYNKILVNPTSGNVTVTLPTLADNQNRKIYLFVTHAGGKVTLDGEGAETINGAASYYLQGQYDRITVIAGASEWSILEYYAHYDTGFINRSDWTNVHAGTSAFDVDNRSAGNFTIGEKITESTSGNTGIVQSDDGTTIYVKNVTGTGIWTNNETVTGGTSGETALVNEASGSNKNQDTNILHGFVKNLSFLRFRLIVSTDGTANNSFEVKDSSVSANVHGQTFWQIDTSNLKLQTATDGIEHTSDTGANVQIDTEDWYYRIIVEATI